MSTGSEKVDLPRDLASGAAIRLWTLRPLWRGLSLFAAFSMPVTLAWKGHPIAALALGLFGILYFGPLWARIRVDANRVHFRNLVPWAGAPRSRVWDRFVAVYDSNPYRKREKLIAIVFLSEGADLSRGLVLSPEYRLTRVRHRVDVGTDTRSIELLLSRLRREFSERELEAARSGTRSDLNLHDHARMHHLLRFTFQSNFELMVFWTMISCIVVITAMLP